MLATIGYENASLDDFVETLAQAGVEMIVDIRERAQSRRPGFSKSALAEALKRSDIDYLHFRELGDPKEGREAARKGRMDVFDEIFREVMASSAAKEALEVISSLARKRKICLLCYERDKNLCHRKIVSERLESMLNCKTSHLGVRSGIASGRTSRRVLHSNQGAATPL